MNDRKILATGLTGTVIAAICCFTPVLVIALGVVGLSAWLAWMDYVLLPALALFLGVTAYGLWVRWRAAICSTSESDPNKGSVRHV